MSYYDKKAARSAEYSNLVVTVLRWLLMPLVAMIGWLLGPEDEDDVS